MCVRVFLLANLMRIIELIRFQTRECHVMYQFVAAKRPCVECVKCMRRKKKKPHGISAVRTFNRTIRRMQNA